MPGLFFQFPFFGGISLLYNTQKNSIFDEKELHVGIVLKLLLTVAQLFAICILLENFQTKSTA
jgi:hypothetical protein